MKKYLNNNFDSVKLINVFDELPIWSAPFGLKLLDAVEYKPNKCSETMKIPNVQACGLLTTGGKRVWQSLSPALPFVSVDSVSVRHVRCQQLWKDILNKVFE